MEALVLEASFGTQANRNRYRSSVKLDHHLAHQSSKLALKMLLEWAILGQTQLRNATTLRLISQVSSS